MTASNSARSPWRRTAAVLAVACATAVPAAAPAGAVTPPRPDRGAAIEDFAPYQAQFLCDPKLRKGVKAFRDLVLKTYPGTKSVSEGRGCDGGTSEHHDGRAWDWGVDVRKPAQKKKAEALIGWLLAPDEHGNDAAMARRLGIMYVIWNKRMWSGWSGWKPYECSGVTQCHKDHVHFSFGWAGAKKKTSFWTGDVSPVEPPPIPVFGTSGSYTVRVPASKDKVWGAKALRGGALYQLTATGTWHRGAGDAKRADAACFASSDGTWHRGTALRMSGVWNWTPTVDTGGGCNTKDHTYTATVVPWVTDAVSFSLQDGKRSDNSGSVTVRFKKVV